jgi:two-component system response regulator PilR (NtrC family)
MNKILIVDDEKSMREFLTIMLEDEGFSVREAATGSAAIRFIQDEEFDLIISDLKMQGIGGIDILTEARRIHPNTPVIMITAFATTDTAVTAMKLGAYDFITKPFNVEQVKLVIRKAIERKRLVDENILLKNDLERRFRLESIIGDNKDMRGIFSRIRKVADSPSTVLVLGESGTGKELVAHAIHNLSIRRDKQFVTVNCAAITETLLESELFGHVKGAFTGAEREKKGLFEVADGGTFLLDEISEAPLSIQAKLLRVLQEREFKRVGGIDNIKVDVRVIASTNRDLEKFVADGKFREDLYYRLNVIAIKVPPLRERIDDIPVLVDYFLTKYNLINNKKIQGISSEALTLLERHSWPGNVRELENVIERAVVLEDGNKIEPHSLPEKFRELQICGEVKVSDIESGDFKLEEFIEKIEKDILLKALNKAGGAKQLAAKSLNISFRSFRYKLQKYNIAKDFDTDEL